MHATQILHRFSDTHFPTIHASRRGCLIDAAGSVMQGNPLRLSRIGRGMVRRQGTFKAALKRVDRLVGNPRIEAENRQASCAIVSQLCALRGESAVARHGRKPAPACPDGRCPYNRRRFPCGRGIRPMRH